MKTIQTEQAPVPAGHYSQAIVHDGLVYISGQLAIDPKTGEKRAGSIEEQTRLVLQNLSAILEASGSSLNRILQVTVYISDISLWGKVNEVYAEIFGEHKPARAIVPTRDLHFGFKIEVAAVAAVNEA
jgi:2-iminobutanoate/2-iminopropanoate deaminase